ncbi:uncharacterized protein LOC113383688 [Ctenocephalides felis]|uniref:uncharacterized protein LOC113383688 n=1 Tax=Ctenocephalides felis TaxID=7515 RepID=UPI000E6E1850|nr:uncharacterized protein LOC113383688 [Ctenocephalides felis]
MNKSEVSPSQQLENNSHVTGECSAEQSATPRTRPISRWRPKILQSRNTKIVKCGLKQAHIPAPVSSKGGSCKVVQNAVIKRRSALTPKRCNISKMLIREVRRINKQCNNSRDKLQQSIQCSEKFGSIPETLNVRARNFILSRLRDQTKIPKGRKFTNEDKILALTLIVI